MLREAIRIFAERGFWGANTTEIAHAAGISQAYLYRLFASKEALFVAVLEEVKSRIDAAIDRVFRDAAPGEVIDALLAPEGAGLDGDPDAAMVLLHATAASSIEPIGEAVRECYRRQVDNLGARGLSDVEIRKYLAWSQYDNALRAAKILPSSPDERERRLVRG